ncbi:hypothetical protein LXA37_17900 [Erwinia amylovora]|uniref:hypothetical protein n=1 Tax=Erwinia amylovora TaxID=552 RepID=UPI0020BE8866|nr:hypothetical protein [Erwinia amylovora]MCK8414393.1 hypothetical protein [Erwinia amylovora]
MISHCKIPFVLFFAVLISSLFVFTTEYILGLLSSLRVELVVLGDAMDIVWRILIL